MTKISNDICIKINKTANKFYEKKIFFKCSKKENNEKAK